MTVEEVERGTAPGGVTDSAPGREVMPGGIALSATLHIGMLALIVLGLPSLFRHKPPPETPIAVELVMIAPETRATHPNPFRPKPEAKPEPAVAAPAPKPEPKPEPPKPVPEPPASAAAPPMPAPPQPPKPEVKAPPPPPPPPPKPVETQAPPPPPPAARPSEPKPKPEPRQAHHTPRPDIKKADPAAFQKLLQSFEDKKPERADFDRLLKNLSPQQIAQAEEAPPARPRLAATAPPSSQPKAPLGSQLTASELDALREMVRQQLMPCWSIPAGARDAKDLHVEIRAAVSLDGTVRQATIIDQARLGDPLFRAAAESARRTFFNPQCAPLKLPADKYEVWKDLVVDFNPRDLL